MSIKLYLKRLGKYVFHGVKPTIVNTKVYQLSSTNRLLGKKILITGGGKGLGFAIAKKCIEEGAFVLITGRNGETLKRAVEELGEKAEYIIFDQSKTEEIGQFFSNIQKVWGKEKIDGLVCNAGISLHEKDYSEVTNETWDKQMSTNLKGTYFLIQKYINHLHEFENCEGNILIMSSERGLYCDDIPYGLTKASLCSLTRGLARRLIGKGIRVNAIAPGVTVSEMTKYTSEDNLYREATCGKRVFLPEEVAEVALFLLCEVSKCISGEVIACDQGNYLRCDW